MSDCVLIPWQPPAVDGGRARALEWCIGHWQRAGLEVVVGEQPPGPWSKGAACIEGLRLTGADRILFADADSIIDDPGPAFDALDRAPWVMPFARVHRLSPRATEATYASGELVRKPLLGAPMTGIAGGGIVGFRREAYQDCGGFDPALLWHGVEDVALRRAATCLLGEPEYLRGHMTHLHHEPAPRVKRPQTGLAVRYKRAELDPVAMAALVSENAAVLRSLDLTLSGGSAGGSGHEWDTAEARKP